MNSQTHETEQGVIGAMLIDAACIPDVLERLTPEDFYGETTRSIFTAIRDMQAVGTPIDRVTVTAKLPESQEYIAAVIENTPTAANVMAYAALAREHAILRAAHDATTIEEIEAAARMVAERQTVEVIDMGAASSSLFRELDERCSNGQKIAGLLTGYHELDELLGGLRAGNMTIIAARSGMGKSTLVLNIATEVAQRNNCGVLIFSLEMTVVELTERVFSRYAEVALNKIRDAAMVQDEWDRLVDSSIRLSKVPLHIVEAPTLKMEDITRICHREKPGLVIIDHLGLVTPSGKSGNRQEAVGAISRAIKCLSKDLKIPVIVAAQLNRAVMARANKTPILSDLRESGAIEQDADAVIFIDRPAYYDQGQDENEANLIIAKNRHGRTDTLRYRWDGSHQKFSEGH
ncbi:replicative DNA helicase [Clostridia bacterium]|nr:replicative DNA helicase [Clostridia bacterium]